MMRSKPSQSRRCQPVGLSVTHDFYCGGARMYHAKNRGFTLLEMMVSVAILAILFTVVYSAIGSAVNARESNRRASEQWVKLHRAMTVIEQDMLQITRRYSRFSEQQRSLNFEYGEANDGLGLSFVRKGWPITQNPNASDLVRIAYDIEPDTTSDSGLFKLRRRYWKEVDDILSESAHSRIILRGVKSMSVRLMDADKQWVEHWPTDDALSEAGVWDSSGRPNLAPLKRLPRAIELTLDVDQFGEIKRVFILSEAHGL